MCGCAWSGHLARCVRVRPAGPRWRACCARATRGQIQRAVRGPHGDGPRGERRCQRRGRLWSSLGSRGLCADGALAGLCSRPGCDCPCGTARVAPTRTRACRRWRRTSRPSGYGPFCRHRVAGGLHVALPLPASSPGLWGTSVACASATIPARLLAPVRVAWGAQIHARDPREGHAQCPVPGGAPRHHSERGCSPEGKRRGREVEERKRKRKRRHQPSSRPVFAAASRVRDGDLLFGCCGAGCWLRVFLPLPAFLPGLRGTAGVGTSGATPPLGALARVTDGVQIHAGHLQTRPREVPTQCPVLGQAPCSRGEGGRSLGRRARPGAAWGGACSCGGLSCAGAGAWRGRSQPGPCAPAGVSRDGRRGRSRPCVSPCLRLFLCVARSLPDARGPSRPLVVWRVCARRGRAVT